MPHTAPMTSELDTTIITMSVSTSKTPNCVAATEPDGVDDFLRTSAVDHPIELSATLAPVGAVDRCRVRAQVVRVSSW